jgi:hypothetical protein
MPEIHDKKDQENIQKLMGGIAVLHFIEFDLETGLPDGILAKIPKMPILV